jgi:hypothetical protein
MTLPHGHLAANEMVLSLAKSLADEEGYISLDALVRAMDDLSEGNQLPGDLRQDQVVNWLQLKSSYVRYGKRAGRLGQSGVEVLPDLEDNQMMHVLGTKLHRSEVDFMLSMSVFDGSKLYWKAMDLYQNRTFTSNAVREIRSWALGKFRAWPRDLSSPKPWLA